MLLKKKICSLICFLTAAAMTVSCGKQAVPVTDMAAELPYENTSDPDVSAPEMIPEVFSVLTVSGDRSEISADGFNAGKSYCGFTVHDDGSVTVSVDGEELPFEKASEKTGCVLTENPDGTMSIRAPFQKSQVIVSSEKNFETYGADSVEETLKDHFLLTYSSPSAAYSAYKQLSEDENIRYAEPNIVFLSEGFNETKRIGSWGLDQIGAVDFCSKLSTENAELPEIDVAVIDSGINYDHEIFEGRILEGGRNFCPDYPEETKNTAIDDAGHGSHCAGIICSSTNDNVKILPVKSLDINGYADMYTIFCGMMYAIECDVDIISMSLGAYGRSNLISEAVDLAYENGITVCVAAGNESVSCLDSYSAISELEKCVVISAVDEELNPSSYSNYQNIDFAAPGDAICSASAEGRYETELMSGTSMATPFAAACFANVLSYDNTLSSEEVYDIVKANAVDLCEPGYDDQTGWGMVSLKNFRMSAERDEPENEGENSETEQYRITNGVLRSFDTEGIEILDLAELVRQKKMPEFSEVGPGVFANSTIKEVILPDSVKTISSSAFENCSKLKKVTSKAEFIKDKAFFNCTYLAELDDSCIKETGRNAFNGCSSLARADFTGLTDIPENAFFNCRKLRTDSFCFEKIKKISNSAFSASGICGSVDLSSCESVGSYSFSDTCIETVILSDKITSLSSGLFYNCSSLKKISAPSVKEINSYSLALGKRCYSEENAVETDIDFSGLIYISDEYAFEGYVFSGPVSFDLAGSVSMKKFSGAYGESLSLPSATEIDFDDYPDLNFYALNFESVTSLYIYDTDYRGIIGLGDNLSDFESDHFSDEYEFVFASLNDDPGTISFIENRGFYCGSSSELMKYPASDSLSAFMFVEMHAAQPGKHLKYNCTITDNETGKTVYSKENSDFPVMCMMTDPGEYTYTAEVTDPSGKVVYSENKVIFVSGTDIHPLTAGVPYMTEHVNNEASYGDEYNMIFSFVPENDGSYDLYSSSSKISFIRNDGSVTDLLSRISLLDLKKGETYYFCINYYHFDESLYISVDSEGNQLSDISDFIYEDSVLCFTEPDGTKKVSITDYYGNHLEEGNDYTVFISEEDIYGYNTVIIYGKGSYFGTYVIYKKISPIVKVNEPFSSDKMFVDFVPDKSGMYSVVLPSDLQLDLYEPYSPLSVSVYNFNKGMLISYFDYYFESSFVDTDPLLVSMYLEKGVRYRIDLTGYGFGESYEITITDRILLLDCEASYTFSYRSDGGPVEPDIELSYKGNILKEGTDYTLEVRDNTSSGLMYVTAEGCGDYIGKLNFVMVIEGEGIKVGNAYDKDVLFVDPDKEFEYHEYVPYCITFEHDTYVQLAGSGVWELYGYLFDTEDDGADYIYIGNYESAAFVKKGTYALCVYSSDPERSPLHENIKVITDDNVRPIQYAQTEVRYDSDGTPELIVQFNGAALKEDEDYVIAYSETNSDGSVTLYLEGIKDYSGSTQVTYQEIYQSAGTGVIKDETENHIDPAASLKYEWISSGGKYYFNVSSYPNIKIHILNEDGIYLYGGNTSKKEPLEFTAESDVKYLVYISSDFTDEFDLSLKKEGRISDCTAEYDSFIPYTDSREIPDVVFRDGEYVLEEGKDYILFIDGFISKPGRREYVYRGCGKYYGDVTIPVVTYDETIDDLIDFEEADKSTVYHFKNENKLGYVIGDQIKLKISSDSDKKMLYHIDLSLSDNESAEYVNVFMYDSSGSFIGANDDIMHFVLNKGETVYIVIIPPYVTDYDVQTEAYHADVRIYSDIIETQDTVDLPGDINCDGEVNVLDMIRLMRYILGTGKLSDQGMSNSMLSEPENKEGPDAQDLVILKNMILLAK